jgi:peptidoglycan/LPS O-acetylase OafA/YrhL
VSEADSAILDVPAAVESRARRAGEDAHYVQLDGLRALAVLVVMARHFVPTLEGIGIIGWLGVRLFFVLSGFLITGILLRGRSLIESGNQSNLFTLRQFYIRRFLRIFPLYYFVLIVLAICNAEQVREFFWWHAAYLSNHCFIEQTYFSKWVGHFWSLAVEEQFYLLWPAVIFFTPRKILLPVILLTVAVGPVFRYLLGIPEYGLWAEVSAFGCLDALGMGAVLALFQSGAKRYSKRTYAIVTLVGFVIVSGSLTAFELLFYWREMYAIFGLGFAIFCAGAIGWSVHGIGGPVGAFLRWRPLVYVGVISYGLYVYHGVLNEAAGVMKSRGWISDRGAWWVVAGLFASSFAIAALSWHFFEKPINNLKRHFPYRRRT